MAHHIETDTCFLGWQTGNYTSVLDFPLSTPLCPPLTSTYVNSNKEQTKQNYW